MLPCHFKFSFKKGKLNFRFIGTLTVKSEFVSKHFSKVHHTLKDAKTNMLHIT